jgi:nitroreductase
MSEVLKAIVERRSVPRFQKREVPEEFIEKILEAGRWAPSYANLQPWEFIVVRDAGTKEMLTAVAEKVTIYRRSIENADAVVVVVADPEVDPLHYREDAAVATQNMALAAHALGIASYWIGIPEGGPGSAEALTKEILGIPDEFSVVALLPLGYPDPGYTPQKERRPLEQMVHYDRYGNRKK